MNDKICPAAEKCPIFSGVLQGIEMTSKAYKTRYCEAGEAGRQKCKRWQVKEAFGKVPEKLLPNSDRSVQDIAKDNGWV